jgi:hypothetical protein
LNSETLIDFESLASNYSYNANDKTAFLDYFSRLIEMMNDFLIRASESLGESAFFAERDELRLMLAPIDAILEKLPQDLRSAYAKIKLVYMTDVLSSSIVPQDFYESVFVDLADALATIENLVELSLDSLADLTGLKLLWDKYQNWILGGGVFVLGTFSYLLFRR